MRLTLNELRVTIWCEKVVAATKKLKENDLFDLKALIAKMESFTEYAIRYILDRKKQDEVDAAAEEVTRWVERYSGTRDPSLIFEYDAMKKDHILIFDKLSVMRATLDAELMIAEEDIKIIRYKIANEIRESGRAKSVTEADRLALIDPRYERALEDYRVLLLKAFLVRRKYEVMDKGSGFVNQSVSVGRIGMMQQSFDITSIPNERIISGNKIGNP